ncbi:MAG: outer membrane protein assembly factor BamA [Rhodospirillaceae bacterium]|nr:outer membrane protein assembly factor BamA [Rhodospirillaceae bacterium]
MRILTGLLLGVVLLAGIMAATSVGPASAQTRDGFVRNIIVQGTRRIDPQTIAGYLIIKQRDRFDQSKIDESLKALYGTGLFRDVSFRRQGNDLIIRVVENPIVNRVAFEGNVQINNEDLASEANIQPRTVYSRAKVEEAVRRMLAAYRVAGRFAATITPKVIPRSQNRLDMVFEIEEGDKTLVRRVSFIGNKVYSDSTLRDAINTKESAFWRFFGSSDVYDPAKLDADKEILRSFYLDRGFAEFRVLSAVAELSPDRQGFFITITVQEGPRYRFGKLTIESQLRRIDSSRLRGAVKAADGGRYSADKVQRTIVALADVAGSYGYAFVRVLPRVNLNKEAKTAAVTFVVEQGPRVFIERIDIIGNVRTRDSVIRREILVAEGDAFNTTKIRQSRRRLVNTGYFEKVDINRSAGTAPDKVRLTVEVTEKSTGELSIGGGFSTQDGPLGTIGVRETNFLGRGYDLRLSLQLSLRSSQIDFSFTDKHFLERDVAFGVDVFRIDRGYQGNFSQDSSFRVESIGGRLRAGYWLTENVRQSIVYELSNRRVKGVASSASEFIRAERGSSTTSIIGTAVTWDTRDNRFDPTDGFVVRGGSNFAGLGGSEAFYKISSNAGYWMSVSEGWVIWLLGEANHIGGIGQDVRLHERFFLGGNNLRGFEFGGVGPRDRRTGDSLGANNFWVVTAEMAFPLGLPKELGLKGRVFTDVGSAFGIDVSGPALLDRATPRVTVGFGLSWRSPLGPLRLNFGFPVAKQSLDQTQLFNFRFGVRF